MPDPLAAFSKRARLSFSDPSLLQLALTHSSWIFEHGLDKRKCNERLEFLGDAVLELGVSLLLYKYLPQMTEGRMTQIRSLLTREETLAQLARDLDIGSVLRLGKGEEISGGREKDSNLADALEAVIGAFFLDKGPDVTQAWIEYHFIPYFKKAKTGSLRYDFKSALQEVVQSTEKEPQISYAIIRVDGPEHQRRFTSQLYLDGKAISQGSGRSKKEAEQQAAQRALDQKCLFSEA